MFPLISSFNDPLRTDAVRRAGIAVPALLGPLRLSWTLPVTHLPEVAWSRPLRDWVCWATAPDFISVPRAEPANQRDVALPDWARCMVAARRLRELAIEGSVGPWSTGRIRRMHTQLLPTVPSTLRERSAWFGGNAGEQPLRLLPTPELLPGLLEDLAEFINWPAPDPLAHAALVHAQLLAIHPFADGNARLARVLATSVAVRGGIAPEAMFPVFAQTRRRGHEALEAAERLDGGIEAVACDWRDTYRRGVTFAGVLQSALDKLADRLATHLGGETRAQRLLAIASARPVLDEYLVRASVGAGQQALVTHWQALRAEGWVPLSAGDEGPPWLAGTRFWQRAAALWTMAANAGPASANGSRCAVQFDEATS